MMIVKSFRKMGLSKVDSCKSDERDNQASTQHLVYFKPTTSTAAASPDKAS